MSARQQKITLGEMRAEPGGTRGLLVYCAHACGHHSKLAPDVVDKWPDDVRLSDLEPQFICQKCGRRGADLRPDFAPASMGTANTR